MKQVLRFLNSKYLIYIVPVFYLLVVILNLTNIGIGWDTPVNLNKGEQVYNFLTQLKSTYLSDSNYVSNLYNFRYFKEIPAIENGHPPAFSFISFVIGHFFSSIFGFRYYFFHFANIFLTFLGLIYMAKVIEAWGDKVSYKLVMFSQILLISIPQFFVYSVTSTKDVPVIFLTLISIYYLSTINSKNYTKHLILFTFCFTIAFFSKFTAIFTVPIILYLLFLKKDLLISPKSLILIFATFLFNLVIFWPHLIFNFGIEVAKLNFVYVKLPTSSLSEEIFTYYYLRQLPFVHTLLFLITLFMVPLIKIRTKILLWLGPALLYLILVNRYYQVFRQFLFVLPVLAIAFYFVFDYSKKHFKKINSFKFILLVPLFVYFMYLLFLPPYKKVFYSSFIADKSTKDVWGVSLPVALNYAYKTYQPTNIYYSPLSFLMEYQKVSDKGYVITYVPQNSNIWIANPQVNAYSEEQEVREKFYTKDTNFVDGGQSLEIWVRNAD